MNAPRLVVGATFTARPLEKHLLDGGAGRVEFTPYNQLIQWLLNPPAGEAEEIPVFLVRMADFIRREQGPDETLRPLLRERAEACAEALGRYCAARPVKPWLLIVPSGDAAALCRDAENLFRNLDCLRHLAWDEVESAIGGNRIFDPVADRLGHIPLTMDGFKVLAKHILARLGEDAPAAELPAVAAGPASAVAPDGLRRFLGKLKLRVACRPISTPEQFSDAAKLSHTAATFHATGRRYTVEALRAMLDEPDLVGLSIDVADRFGDYGSMGFLLIAGRERPVLREFVLSCVVLGKQVEHCVVHALAAAAEGAGIGSLAFDCADREGNTDVTTFLDALCRVAGGVRNDMPDGRRLDVPASALKAAALATAMSEEAAAAAAVVLEGAWWGSEADAAVA